MEGINSIAKRLPQYELTHSRNGVVVDTKKNNCKTPDTFTFNVTTKDVNKVTLKLI